MNKDIFRVDVFNRMQDFNYLEYCNKCKNNGLQPEPQSKYFPRVDATKGFVFMNTFGEIHYRKTKNALKSFLNL